MTNINTEVYKKNLEAELKTVEAELQSVGRKNPDNQQDWEAKPQEMDTHRSEADEVADNIEGFEENTAILKELEIRYNEIKDAIKNIEEGKYGICKICGKEIEEARLNANPAASTCIEHKDN